jgi:hypothetical protein
MSEIYFGRIVRVLKIQGSIIVFTIIKPENAGPFELDFANKALVLAVEPTMIEPKPGSEGYLYCTEKAWEDLNVPISRHDPFDGGNKVPHGDSLAPAPGEDVAPPERTARGAAVTEERRDDPPESIMHAPTRTVTIDFVRDGKPDGVPLSPRTKYIALCGEHPSVKAAFSLDQSAVVAQLAKRVKGPAARKESTSELGSAVTKFLANVKGWRRDPNAEGFVHLRLVFSQRELGLLPFELLRRDLDAPPLLIDESEQTILTRELRHGPRVAYRWPSIGGETSRAPRVLFAWASSTAPVLYEAHEQALKRALEPWARPRPRTLDPDYRELLTTIGDTSLERIEREFGRRAFSHVHLVAHGVPLNAWRGPSFGIALRGDEHGRPVVVRAGELVGALTAQSEDRPRCPSVVTLGSCDSAHMGDVAAAESSVAHALHGKGLPFVIGLQFGINSKASAKIFGELYRRILLGEDPRISMFYARKTAHGIAEAGDDWASMVAYASFPDDLAAQASRNALSAVIGTLDAATAWADEAIAQKSKEGMKIARDRAHDALDRLDALERGWKACGGTDRSWRAEHLGARGSAYKRRAELAHRWDEPFVEWLKKAREAYREAFDVEVSNHWVGVQSLAITAMLAGDLSSERQRWTVCEYIALLQTESKNDGERAWAHGSLVELYLLEPLLAPHNSPSGPILDVACERALPHLLKLRAIGKGDGRYVPATKRQLMRYANKWCFVASENRLNDLSTVAQKLLTCLDQSS